eukprot:7445736-Pyramimonas_sp.AAC.1
MINDHFWPSEEDKEKYAGCDLDKDYKSFIKKYFPSGTILAPGADGGGAPPPGGKGGGRGDFLDGAPPEGPPDDDGGDGY